jgi:hypothetical protein
MQQPQTSCGTYRVGDLPLDFGFALPDGRRAA